MQGHAAAGQVQHAADAIRWAADYLIKAHTAPDEFVGQVGRPIHIDISPCIPVVVNINPAFKIILNNIRTPSTPFGSDNFNIQPRKATPPGKSHGV